MSGWFIEVPNPENATSTTIQSPARVREREDAEFIAALNPAVVVALLDRIEAAERCLQRLVRALDIEASAEMALENAQANYTPSSIEFYVNSATDAAVHAAEMISEARAKVGAAEKMGTKE